ncbi:MAG: hypothetical protein NW226_05510 [Microscillaceae bacterium]|nr:hypothetical protein [Microscillaceae bacterium]
MKILLDECVTRKLKKSLAEFEVFTVAEMGWGGLKNGKLIQKTIENNFDILLTIDKNMEFQQNLNSYPVTVVVFDVLKSKIDFLEELVPLFKIQIDQYEKGKAYRLNK